MKKKTRESNKRCLGFFTHRLPIHFILAYEAVEIPSVTAGIFALHVKEVPTQPVRVGPGAEDVLVFKVSWRTYRSPSL